MTDTSSTPFSTVCRVPTGKASRYLQQLCKHWEHSTEVRFDESHGEVVIARDAKGGNWPADALITLDADADALACRITASVPEHRDLLKTVLKLHLERFAFREVPLTFDWQDGPA